MNNITVGITAHVDSGKTTLSEAMLYLTGEIRKLGRVDHGSSWLDTSADERSRGITVFAHQASINLGDKKITLLDTPGHTDFASETERTMQVLDYAILVISAVDGVQSHTATLWRLLEKYNVPVFIFVNKTDLPGISRQGIMEVLSRKLSPMCVDFGGGYDKIAEGSAECCEELMEKYLSGERLSSSEIATAIGERKIFPCCFGSALKLEGVEEFLGIFGRYTREPVRRESFAAKAFKISTDAKGNRLTYMKICGGELRLRDELEYTSASGERLAEKISGIRFYSGSRFTAGESACAGEICAVTGLSASYAGQGLGSESDSAGAFLEPVMSYKLILPENVSPYDALAHMRRLEDEDPQLNVMWNEQLREIHVRLMGAVQLEIITGLVAERFGYEISFGSGDVSYRETISATVEGIGHYEPLRHYAEVHLLLEPLERGSGLQFGVICREDDLDRNWQRLILTHLEEKIHRGVLTGSSVTDMKIVLASGRAHLKHTEGGDFRQATYRAVRQGLRSAESVLLEPYYDYELEIPTECVGRAMTDIRRMCGSFEAPETFDEMSVIRGSAPVSEMNDYPSEVISYTRGKGRLSLTVSGYKECHNAEEVISRIGYDPDRDTENTADSVFCSHGAGHAVRWDEVKGFMHLPSCLDAEEEFEEEIFPERLAAGYVSRVASDEELMEIFERTYGKINREPIKAMRRDRETSAQKYKGFRQQKRSGTEYLLVDGYNIIFAWDELKKIASESLDAARSRLANILCNYQGYRQCEVILVFDAYKVKGHHRETEKFGSISIVYTKESETADSYIEKVSHELASNHPVRVATSDGLEQLIILGNGARRVSATELAAEVKNAEKAIRDYIEGMKK